MNSNDLFAKLQETVDDDEAKKESKLQSPNRVEKAEFKKKMKGHYANEFNVAAVLRAKAEKEDAEEEEK